MKLRQITCLALWSACHLVAMSHDSMADLSSYVCEITDFEPAGGVNRNAPSMWLAKKAKETTVAIDRKTGRVIHPIIGNTSFTYVTLLNEGSEDWSFKSLSDSGRGPEYLPGGNVQYYEVHEYVEASRKPFLAVSGGIAYFGICE